MTKLSAKLRWYPYDALVEIRQQDLDKIAREFSVNISMNGVAGQHFITEGKTVYEETMTSPLEEISQTVVTVEADDEPSFRNCLKRLIRQYRAPRTPYSNWGSDDRAKEIIVELADECDGWF